MILDASHGLVEVRVAQLKTLDRTSIRYFSTSVGVISYLKAHPDVEFLLEPQHPGQILPGGDSDEYGPEFCDVYCGKVRFDSASNEVECG